MNYSSKQLRTVPHLKFKQFAIVLRSFEFFKYPYDDWGKATMQSKEYAAGLAMRRKRDVGEEARINVIDFFNNHEKFCVAAYSYYLEYKSNVNRFVEIPRNSSKSEIYNRVNNVILLITANHIERGIFLRRLSDFYGDKLPTYSIGAYSYQIINKDNYTIVHLHTGRTGDEFTRRAINAAHKVFKKKIKCIILLGICYGIDFSEQCLGEVVISNAVSGYRINFRDEENDLKFEPELEFEEKPSKDWITKIESIISYFHFSHDIFSKPDGEEIISFNAYTGKILSSNSLLSSRDVKEAVVNYVGHVKPKAYGGEMEACGIFKTNIFETSQGFKNWIIIKAICDWGESKNALDSDKARGKMIKDSVQAFAMTNACVTFFKLLEQGIFNL